MKILLLGANGQLGVDILRANQLSGREFTIDAWTRDDLDVTQKETISEKLVSQSFDVLINCIGYTHTEKAETDIATAFSVNAFSVKEIAAICKMKKARLIQISTDYVFGSNKGAARLTENAAPAPLSIYGASKLMGESFAELMADTLIFRTASLFGVAGASGKGGNFVESMIRLGRERGQLRIIADQVMSPTATNDIAEIILKAIQRTIPAGIYNLVNTGQASWYEFACRIIEKAKVSAEVLPILAVDYPSAITRSAFTALDNQKIARLLGPIRPWEEALDHYLQEKGYAG